VAQAHNNLGNLLAKDATRVSEAEAEYRAAMALDPKDAGAHNNLGNLLAKDATRAQEAEAEYRAAIELDPKLAQAHNNLGLLLAQDATRVREAEAEYRAAIELDPKLVQAHNNLGVLLAQDATRVREAEAEYRAAIELDPKDAAAYENIMILLRRNDREEEAIPFVEKWMQLDPQNFDPPLALASIHKKYGRLSESAKFAEQARKLIKEDDWYNLACLESVCGNVDAAIAHLRRAAQSEKFDRDRVKRDPDFEWIREDARFKEIVGE
jgi:Tfp pilus assembly protein PilF